jgi:NADH:ubiquinone reductase (H+-translocating)
MSKKRVNNMNTLSAAFAATKRVVIVGAGFAGLNCAKTLASNPDLQITLIDRNNYQQFKPLLYQVATGILSPENAAFNIRDVFADYDNVDVGVSEIASVDLATKTVHGKSGDSYQGDFLVLAAGTEANFFGIPGAKQYSLPIYSLLDAERLRSRLLGLIETAILKARLGQKAPLHFVVVGGGATGVETAGAIADILRGSPRHLYSDLDLSNASITLVDLGDRVLAPFTSESQKYASRVLQERGVQLRLGISVQQVTESDVLLSDGSRIPASLIIWAAGLKAASLSGSIGLNPGRSGRLDVKSDLSVAGYPDVYALGDFANMKDEDGRDLPQLASVAQQAGRHCGKNILATVAGEGKTPFAYFDKGIMAMVGRDAAVAELGSRHVPINGPFAFAAWLGVHAVLMTSARAEMEAILEWAWDYFGGVRVGPILDRSIVKS